MPAATLALLAGTTTLGYALVTTDASPLRAAPRDSAQPHAVLRYGELLEVRGERLDHLQVYEHHRERAGFVRAGQVRRLALTPEEAPELLALLRHVREQTGQEALGIGLAAAWLKAAPAAEVQSGPGIEAMDALATQADRLAQRASGQATTGPSGTAAAQGSAAVLTAHLEVAGRYGVRFRSYEQEGRMQVCYDGELFLRVLGTSSAPLPRARAALGLTRPECVDPALSPLARAQLAQWRAEILDRVDTAALPSWLANRIYLRRAAVWSSLAWHFTRQGREGMPAAQRALDALAAVRPAELPDSDLAEHNSATMRVNASRWAAATPVADAPARADKRPRIEAVTTDGQTCVSLRDGSGERAALLARQCTYSVVWTSSATLNREGTALALAVQPLDSWRELWMFRRQADGRWTISVLPPASTTPDVGYAEFAGWVPGGQQVLVARESRGEGRYRRSFEVVSLDSLATVRQSGDPAVMGPFQRWQDPGWKRHTVSLR